MCGIAGIQYFRRDRPVDQSLLRAMTDRLEHRGPDSEGFHIDGNVGLGFRRLRIIDLSAAANQPLCNEDRTVWIIFNGEIYNFRDLRVLLESKGHQFRTHSDTEVIVHLYEEFGTDCLSHLQGMFAFAIWDKSRRRLFLARDRLGIKPLCFYKDAERLIFASEIKAILADPTIPRRIDDQALYDYFHFMSVPQPESIFEGIQKVLPGHYMVVEGDRVADQEYWDLPRVTEYLDPRTDVQEELIDRLQNVVTSHLVSDVPLGAFLSGGVDSSAIVAMMGKTSRDVLTYSITLKGDRLDESKYAHQVSALLGAHHHEFNVTPNLVETLPKITWYLEEPFAVPAGLATYYLAQTARSEVTVALSGDGSDELFAGYSYRLHLDETLKRFWYLPLAARRLLADGSNGIPAFGTRQWRERWISIQRFTRSLANTPDDAYLSTLTMFDHRQLQSIVEKRVDRVLPSSRFLRDYYASHKSGSTIQKWLYGDIKTNLVDEMLTKVDKMSMASGLEVRVPFLDHTFVEFAMRIHPQLKLSGKNGKIILKKALEPLLPHEILYRPKQGFSLPVDEWFRTSLKDFLLDHLSPDSLKHHGILHPAGVARLIEDHLKYRSNHGIQLYALLSFQLWYDTFIKGN